MFVGRGRALVTKIYARAVLFYEIQFSFPTKSFEELRLGKTVDYRDTNIWLITVKLREFSERTVGYGELSERSPYCLSEQNLQGKTVYYQKIPIV